MKALLLLFMFVCIGSAQPFSFQDIGFLGRSIQSLTVTLVPAYVQSNSTNNGGAGTKLTCLLSGNATANNIALATTFRNSGSATEVITDSQGLTWTLLTNVTYNAGGQQLAAYWAKVSSTAILRVTNTTSTSLSFNGLQVIEYSGVNNTAPLDVAMTQTGTTSANVQLNVGPMTTTINGDLMILILGAPSTTWASSGGFTLREPQGANTGGSELDMNQTTASAVSASAITANGGNAYGALFVTLKPG